MKKLKLLVIILFFGLTSFFSLGMLIPGASDLAEGGEMPEFILKGSDSLIPINRRFGTEFEDYLSKAFAYRGKVVDAYSDLKLKLLNEGNDQVIAGRGGYLFYSQTLEAFTGENPMTDDEIESAALSLLNLQKYSEETGAKFCFLAAPDKNTIFPEKMPKRYKKADVTDLDRLLSKLDELGVSYVDPRAGLIKAKDSDIYFLTDTHWTANGAFIALELLGEKLDFDVVDTSKLNFMVNRINGDLDSLLYPSKKLTEAYDTFNYEDSFIYTSAFQTEMDMVITTRGSGSGKAIFFRDSFMNMMLEPAASSFAEAVFERANPFRVDLADADYIIVEIAERNLRNLIGCDARITQKEVDT